MALVHDDRRNERKTTVRGPPERENTRFYGSDYLPGHHPCVLHSPHIISAAHITEFRNRSDEPQGRTPVPVPASSDHAAMLARMTNEDGVIATLDQSGGSTPKAVGADGVTPDAWTNETEMFARVHKMRARFEDCPNLDKRVLAAILFEKSMDREFEGMPAPAYLWNTKGVVPLLQCGTGLASETNCQMMKPISGGATLSKAEDGPPPDRFKRTAGPKEEPQPGTRGDGAGGKDAWLGPIVLKHPAKLTIDAANAEMANRIALKPGSSPGDDGSRIVHTETEPESVKFQPITGAEPSVVLPAQNMLDNEADHGGLKHQHQHPIELVIVAGRDDLDDGNPDVLEYPSVEIPVHGKIVIAAGTTDDTGAANKVTLGSGCEPPPLQLHNTNADQIEMSQDTLPSPLAIGSLSQYYYSHCSSWFYSWYYSHM